MLTPFDFPQSNINEKKSNSQDDAHIWTIYQDLQIVKNLSDSKFSVYRVFSKTNKQNLAMKVFPYFRRQPHPYFTNEIRFCFLSHPNIINFVHFETKKRTVQNNQLNKISYILMDYAPYGDFLSLISNEKEHIDDKLIRTYFRQLIEAIEYLHQNGVAHLDLKLDNLLMGADFKLKVTDFDLSYMQGDEEILSTGTPYYRAPELLRSSSSCSKPAMSFAADIYSAGVILFALKSKGYCPHTEDEAFNGENLRDLMEHDNAKFWEKHCEIQGQKASFFEDSFKDLFNQMVTENPDERLNVRQIKQSKWYNGPVYSAEEVYDKMDKLLNC